MKEFAVWQDELSRLIQTEKPDFSVVNSVSGKNPATGLEIYQRNYLFGLLSCLQDTFPATESCLSENNFRFLAKEFVYSNPPANRSLEHYGSDFNLFLKSKSNELGFPLWISSLALLEFHWSLHSFDNKTSTVVLDWDVLDLWVAITEGSEQIEEPIHQSVRLQIETNLDKTRITRLT